MITCEFCGRDLNPSNVGICQYTKGWVKNRSGGGGHAVHLPEREPRFAHFQCVDRIIKGYDPSQRSLLDAPATVATEPPPTNASFDQGLLLHVCNVCGATAPYGVGVAIRDGDLGLWYCAAHKPWCKVA